MNELVVIKNNDIFTDSLIIAEGTNNQHESIVSLLSTYEKEFSEFGEIRFTDLKSGNPQGGRPTRIYLLNEPQATFLMTLLRNSKEVVSFKLKLTKEFYRMRQFILEKQTAEWQQSRLIGKQTRRDERAIENIISIEVDKGTHYKEIYQVCKAKCNIIKELAFLPSLEAIA